MARLLIVVVLLALAGGVGYWYGRQFVSTPVSQTGVGADTTRARTEPQPADTVEAPPAVGAVPAPPPGSATNLPDASSLPPPPERDRAGASPEGGGGAGQEEATAGALASRGIGLPIAGLTSAQIHDTFHEARGGGERRHEAADIMAPKGTPVIAVDNGIVQKLFNSRQGGLTVYQFDPERRFAYYYAHLDGYAPGLKEGMLLKRGDLIGYVGVTGNSDPKAPHLHFGVYELGPEKKWYDASNRPVNPYPLLVAAASRTGKGTPTARRTERDSGAAERPRR